MKVASLFSTPRSFPSTAVASSSPSSSFSPPVLSLSSSSSPSSSSFSLPVSSVSVIPSSASMSSSKTSLPPRSSSSSSPPTLPSLSFLTSLVFLFCDEGRRVRCRDRRKEEEDEGARDGEGVGPRRSGGKRRGSFVLVPLVNEGD